MIFTIHPYENEPKFASASKTMPKANDDYSQRCQALTIRYAVLDWLRRPEMSNGPWKDVVDNYFRLRGEKVLATARTWAKSNYLIEDFPSNLGTEPAARFSGLPSRIGIFKKPNLLKELEAALQSPPPDAKV